MIRVNNKYTFGDTVYLVTDPEQLKRVVIGIYIRQGGILYEICHDVHTSEHYDFELSDTEDIIMKTSQ